MNQEDNDTRFMFEYLEMSSAGDIPPECLGIAFCDFAFSAQDGKYILDQPVPANLVYMKHSKQNIFNAKHINNPTDTWISQIQEYADPYEMLNHVNDSAMGTYLSWLITLTDDANFPHGTRLPCEPNLDMFTIYFQNVYNNLLSMRVLESFGQKVSSRFIDLTYHPRIKKNLTTHTDPERGPYWTCDLTVKEIYLDEGMLEKIHYNYLIELEQWQQEQKKIKEDIEKWKKEKRDEEKGNSI